MNCDNKCSTCSTKCNLLCPICNKQVKNVPIQTVKSLVKHDINLLETEETYICLNKKCNLVYFQNNNPSYYFKNDVNKPVWFKEKYPNYIVCYCRNIYLKEIVELEDYKDLARAIELMDSHLEKSYDYEKLGIELEL